MRIVLLAVASGFGLEAGRHRSRAALEQRFSARTAFAANFMSTYATQLMEREHVVATANLSGGLSVGGDRFATVVQSFGANRSPRSTRT